MPPPEPPPQNFLEILERVWWRARPRARRAKPRRRGARLRRPGAARRRDDAGRPSRIAEPDRGLAADPRRGLRPISAYARSSATARASAISAATRRGAGSRPAAASPRRRSCAASSACTRASPSPTTRSARPARWRANSEPSSTSMSPRIVADVDDARRRGYAGPLERLMALDALPAGSILAHGVHLSARSGAARGGGRLLVRPQPALQRRQPRRLRLRPVGDAARRARRRTAGTRTWRRKRRR